MAEIVDLERRIRQVESVLIVLSITAVAAADYWLAPDASLGFLYLVPLSYSALAHRWPVFAALLLACVALRQWDFPVGRSDWAHLVVDWTLVGVFFAVVLPLRRFGATRDAFFKTAREQRDALVREVELAAAVQQHLLQQHKPPAGALDVVARTQPARVVGGDYYDFVPLDAGRFAVAVADISGKGLPAALLMPAVKIALRTLAERRLSIPDVLLELNRVFLDNLPPASYFTLFYGVFDEAACQLEFASAGHPPALHVNRKGRVAVLSTGGPAVGLIEDAVSYETGVARLDSGDVLVFYSDGITEAEDAAGAEFGRARLEAIVTQRRAEPAAAIVAAIHDAVDAYRVPGARGDDATVIVARLPSRAAGPFSVMP